MTTYAVTRARNYPFLSAVPVNEERPPSPENAIELTSDEFADYEDAVKRYVEWQKRLAGGEPL